MSYAEDDAIDATLRSARGVVDYPHRDYWICVRRDGCPFPEGSPSRTAWLADWDKAAHEASITLRQHADVIRHSSKIAGALESTALVLRRISTEAPPKNSSIMRLLMDARVAAEHALSYLPRLAKEGAAP